MSDQWHYEQKGQSYIKVDTLHKIRTLETELAEAREELADWHNAAEQVKAEYPDEVHCSCVAILRKQLKDVTEQRDRLAEALKEYREALHDGPENCSYKMYEAVDEFAEKALQSLNQH